MAQALIDNRPAIEGATGPLRVMMLADHLAFPSGPVHGATTYYLNTFPALARAGVDLTVCFLAARHPVAERLAARGVEAIYLGRSKWDARALADVVRIVRERNVEILHTAGLKSNLLGRVAGRMTGCRTVVHLHDTLPPGRVIGFLLRRVARWTDLALGVSQPACEFGVRDYGLRPHCIARLPYGIDMASFTPQSPAARLRVRRELGLEERTPLVGMIGRLAPMKGHEHALRALPRLRELCPDAVLLMAGDGPLRAELESLVESLGLTSAVRFLGQRSDIPDLLAALDVVAMPSVFGEGLPLAAIEAIAAGRPVVGFPTAGIPEVVLDGKTGLLVERGDSQALAEGLARVLLDERLAARLRAGCLEHRENFTVERHVQELLQLYSGLVDRPETA